MLIMWLSATLAVLSASSVARSSDTSSIHVDASRGANGVADGSEEKPFGSLDDAKVHIINKSLTGSPVSAVFVQAGLYKAFSIDHSELSGITWQGVRGSDGTLPIVSGGIEVPQERFRAWPGHDGVLMASLQGLGVVDLGRMVTGNCVADCQHDQVGVSFAGKPMTLARWPNIARDGVWQWAHTAKPTSSGFTIDLVQTPEAKRILRWSNEKHAFVHGYWSADWCDSYGRVVEVKEDNGTVRLSYEGPSDCKASARWMGVNMLCELDHPGEYFIDKEAMALYFYPPEPLSNSTPVVLMHHPGAVVSITSEVTGAKLADMDIRDGRHLGIDVRGTRSTQIENVVVHSHGTHGIDATNSSHTSISQTEVFDVGCSGIRAVGGVAKLLEAGHIRVQGNNVHDFALWKRAYSPGIYWGGVMNAYIQNTVHSSPHNCFLGGGNFEDGVLNRFEGNVIYDCVTETVDSGAFYSCGQGGYAFINRGNVLSGNLFRNIVKGPGSSVITRGSVQAVYLDDQMSGWQIINNTFQDCDVGNFIGGGRDNIVTANRFVRCGTVQYLNNQGMTFDKPAAACTEVAPPGFGAGETTCSTGAAKWMATKSTAAKEYAQFWPEMADIIDDHPGWPSGNNISDNTYCSCKELISSNVGPDDPAKWLMYVSRNTQTYDCSSLLV